MSSPLLDFVRRGTQPLVLADGAGAACMQASTVAKAMRAGITHCTVDKLDVVVTVDVDAALGRLGVGPARATARAGPVD